MPSNQSSTGMLMLQRSTSKDEILAVTTCLTASETKSSLWGWLQCTLCCVWLWCTDPITFCQRQQVEVEEQTEMVNAPSGPSWAGEGWTAGPLEAVGLRKKMGPGPHHHSLTQSCPWSCCTGCCCCSGTGCMSWSWSCSCALRPCCSDLCKRKKRRRRSGLRHECFLRDYHGYLGCSCCGCLWCCCRRLQNAFAGHTRPGTLGWDC